MVRVEVPDREGVDDDGERYLDGLRILKSTEFDVDALDAIWSTFVREPVALVAVVEAGVVVAH